MRGNARLLAGGAVRFASESSAGLFEAILYWAGCCHSDLHLLRLHCSPGHWRRMPSPIATTYARSTASAQPRPWAGKSFDSNQIPIRSSPLVMTSRHWQTRSARQHVREEAVAAPDVVDPPSTVEVSRKGHLRVLRSVD